MSMELPERLTVAPSPPAVIVTVTSWLITLYEHRVEACAAPGANAAMRAATGRKMRRLDMPPRVHARRSRSQWGDPPIAGGEPTPQPTRSPSAAPGSGASSSTPASEYVPSTSTSERTGPIWRGGKFTTPIDKPALELLARVVLDLRAGALDADLVAEVDAQLPRRLARLREVLHLDDAADAHVDGREVVEVDLAHAMRAR